MSAGKGTLRKTVSQTVWAARNYSQTFEFTPLSTQTLPPVPRSSAMCATPASKPHRGPGGVSASMRPSVGSAGGSRHAGRLLRRGAAPVLLGLIQSAVATCRHHPRRPRGGPSALSERRPRAVPLLAGRQPSPRPGRPQSRAVTPWLPRKPRPVCVWHAGPGLSAERTAVQTLIFSVSAILSGRRLGAAPGLVCSPSVLVPVPRPSYHWLAGSCGVHAQTPAFPSQVLLPPESRHCRGLLLMAGPGRLPWLEEAGVPGPFVLSAHRIAGSRAAPDAAGRGERDLTSHSALSRAGSSFLHLLKGLRYPFLMY